MWFYRFYIQWSVFSDANPSTVERNFRSKPNFAFMSGCDPLKWCLLLRRRTQQATEKGWEIETKTKNRCWLLYISWLCNLACFVYVRASVFRVYNFYYERIISNTKRGERTQHYERIMEMRSQPKRLRFIPRSLWLLVCFTRLMGLFCAGNSLPIQSNPVHINLRSLSTDPYRDEAQQRKWKLLQFTTDASLSTLAQRAVYA